MGALIGGLADSNTKWRKYRKMIKACKMIQGIMAIAVATIFIMSGLNFNLVTALTAETGNIPGSEITSTDGSTSAPYSPEQSGSVPAGESNSTITSESSSPPTNGEGQINSPANSLTQTDGAASETESN